MRVALVIMRKELLRFVRDRRALLISLFIPFFLMFLVGAIFQTAASGSGVASVQVPVYAADQGPVDAMSLDVQEAELLEAVAQGPHHFRAGGFAARRVIGEIDGGAASMPAGRSTLAVAQSRPGGPACGAPPSADPRAAGDEVVAGEADAPHATARPRMTGRSATVRPGRASLVWLTEGIESSRRRQGTGSTAG